jgi:hypothetical protein
MFLFFGGRSTKTPLLRQGIIIRVTLASMAQDMPLAAGRWHGSQGPTRHAVGNINEMNGNERSWCEKDDILGLCFLQIERNTMVVTKMVTLSMNMNSLEWFKGKIYRKPLYLEKTTRVSKIFPSIQWQILHARVSAGSPWAMKQGGQDFRRRSRWPWYLGNFGGFQPRDFFGGGP